MFCLPSLMVVPPLLVPQDLTYFQRDRSPVGKICEKSEDEEKKSQKRESEKKRAREMGAVSVVPPIPRIVREEVRRSVTGPRCSMSGLVRVFVLFRGLLFFFSCCRGLGLGDVGRLNRRGRWGLRFGSVVGGQYPRYPRAWVRAKNLEKRSKNLKKFPKNLKKLQKNSRRRVVQNVTRKRYRLHFCRVLLSRRSPGQCSDNFSTSFGQLWKKSGPMSVQGPKCPGDWSADFCAPPCVVFLSPGFGYVWRSRVWLGCSSFRMVWVRLMSVWGGWCVSSCY